MQRTRHSNLVRFFGAGRMENGTPLLIEELMSGGTLKVLLRGAGSQHLDWASKASLAADIARGMAYMHSLGHIHRDLKSSNILVMGRTMQAKVADFGSVGRLLTGRYAVEVSGPSPEHATHRRDLTLGVGTPMYMSLEMLLGAGYNSSTDVWSFGVLMWEIAAQEASLALFGA